MPRFQTRLTPTQKIRTEPVRDRLESAAGFPRKTGLISLERMVMDPCSSPTGTAENMAPFPMAAVMIRMMKK